MPAPAILISATFTADAIEPTLAFWMRELDFDYRIQFAPYNQVFQQLLDPASRSPSWTSSQAGRAVRNGKAKQSKDLLGKSTQLQWRLTDPSMMSPVADEWYFC